MFNKLKLRLTLTNVVVVSFILVIFIAGVYFTMLRLSNNQTEQLIQLISSNAGISDTSNISAHKGHNEYQFRYFYVKLNQEGEVISASEGLDLQNEQIKDIIKKAYNSPKKKAKIELHAIDEPFVFEKGTLANGLGTYIVFVNASSEIEMVGKLLFVLAILGVGGLVLVFFGSLFMANRSLIPIKDSWKRQRDFVADASHELRTPLSVIETTADLVLSRKDKTIESQKKWLENIQTENQRMTKLVNDLLLLARTDSGQVTLEKRDFSLHSALLEVYISIEALAMQRGICLDPFQGPEINFFGDEARIKQLAVILIDNALKHTPAEGHVGMKVRDEGNSIIIEVADTGEGIEKEDINKIFERFYRVDKSRSRADGSTGLGLSIAEWIVKEHQGTIKVESLKGKGTTFFVILPRLRT
jgi:Signal transduction histidine kinase